MQELIDKQYFEGLLLLMKGLCAPFWWRQSDAANPAPYECGTVCFVRTSEQLLGITAAHVHRKICRLRAEEPRTWCQIGAHTFQPETHLIDIDDALDIATYRISEIQLAAIGAHAHVPPEWPPAVHERDVILPCGFPSALSESDEHEAHHQFLWFACRAQRSGADQLGAESFTASSIPVTETALPHGTDLFGMSGGPVFRLEERPLSVIKLVGIIHQYHKDYELFLIRPLNRLTADGRIIRSAAREA